MPQLIVQHIQVLPYSSSQKRVNSDARLMSILNIDQGKSNLTSGQRDQLLGSAVRLVRASAGRGVRRFTIPVVVISRPVGIVVVVAPVPINGMSPTETDCTIEYYARVGVMIPSSCVAIVASAIVVTLSVDPSTHSPGRRNQQIHSPDYWYHYQCICSRQSCCSCYRALSMLG